MLAASCFLTLGALKADAAVVTFQGSILAGGGGTAVLGTIPPDPTRTFTLQLNYTPVSGPNFLANITGGTFSVAPGTNFSVVPLGSTILVANAAPGSEDMAAFTVNVTGPATGTLTFAFDRDAISNNDASEANINTLVIGNSADNFIANFGAAGFYAGNITGVPEPGSCLALLGMIGGGGAWGWRRRQRNAV